MKQEIIQFIQQYGFGVKSIDSHNIEIFCEYGSVLIDAEAPEHEVYNAISRLRAQKPFKRKKRKKKSVKRRESRKRAKENFFKNNPECYLCGIKLDKENRSIDHYIPQSLGGSNAVQNLRAACKVCNVKKGNRIYVYNGKDDSYLSSK